MIACDSVEALIKTKAKRVTVHGTFDPKALKEVRDMKKTEESVSFLYAGEMENLLQALLAAHAADLTISEPDLEEIFMHYYVDGGDEL